MFEKFTSRDAGDFRQRYLGTYGYFRRKGNKSLVRLDRINIEGSRKSVEFVDKDGLRSELYPDSDDDSTGFDFLPPKIAYHNTPSGTYLLRRVPQRQYLRGICDRNTSISSVLGTPYPVDFRVLSELFESNVTVAQAVSAALRRNPKLEERSFALSGQFAISLDNPALYCLGVRIGDATVSPTGVLDIKLDDLSLWVTEIRDAIRRAGLVGEVK